MATEDRKPGDDDIRNDEAPDPALAAAWSALKAQRARTSHANAIDAIETALYSGTSDTDREAALLQVLDGGQADGLRLAVAMRTAARTASDTVAATDAVSARATAHGRRKSRRAIWLRVSAMLATAAVLVLFVRGRGVVSPEQDTDTMRGGDAAITLLTPAPGAPVVDSTRFAWQPVTDAVSYRIAWFDADGREVGARTVATAELIVTRADSATSSRVATWQVEARLPDGRRVTSAMQSVSTR